MARIDFWLGLSCMWVLWREVAVKVWEKEEEEGEKRGRERERDKGRERGSSVRMR